MKSHIDDITIEHYIIKSLPEHELEKIESHIAKCDKCRKNLLITQQLKENKELKKIAAIPVSKEKAQETYASLRPDFRWRPVQFTLVQKILTFYDILFKWFIFLFIPKKYAFATRSSRGFNHKTQFSSFKKGTIHFIKEFEDIRLSLEIIRNRSFDLPIIGPIIRYFISSGTVSMKISLNNVSFNEENVRLTLAGNQKGEFSELLKNQCTFEKFPYDRYALTVEKDAITKGTYFFSIKEAGLYEG
jgi:hypothetical protein